METLGDEISRVHGFGDTQPTRDGERPGIKRRRLGRVRDRHARRVDVQHLRRSEHLESVRRRCVRPDPDVPVRVGEVPQFALGPVRTVHEFDRAQFPTRHRVRGESKVLSRRWVFVHRRAFAVVEDKFHVPIHGHRPHVSIVRHGDALPRRGRESRGRALGDLCAVVFQCDGVVLPIEHEFVPVVPIGRRALGVHLHEHVPGRGVGAVHFEFADEKVWEFDPLVHEVVAARVSKLDLRRGRRSTDPGTEGERRGRDVRAHVVVHEDGVRAQSVCDCVDAL